MSATIDRTNYNKLVDDNGTNTTGTPWNKNQIKIVLMDPIDGALALVAQLTGGNTFSGTQNYGSSGPTIHSYFGTSAGALAVNVRNLSAGPSNSAELSVGNDTTQRLAGLLAHSTTYASSGPFQANSAVLFSQGAAGLHVATTAPGAAMLFWTNGGVRMQFQPSGDVIVNNAGTPGTPVSGALVSVFADQAQRAVGLAVQNLSASNGLYFHFFLNSASGACGNIQQTGAGTVAYNTTSDARLKADGGRATDLTALRAVVVHDFTWKADGRADRGVFAQEAHALYPRAVSPGTDETTADGALARPWMTDYSKFVPDLIVGWQQHDGDVFALWQAVQDLRGELAAAARRIGGPF
jgi:hypothetical protein